MTTYNTGTISVGSGSTTVTGVGTAWTTSGIRAGDDFRAAGLTALIVSVNSATQLTITAWPGSTLSGANYSVRKIDDYSRGLAASNLLLQALGAGNLTSLGNLAGAANKLAYFTGPGAMALTDLTSQARTLLGSTLLSRSGDNLVTAGANTRITGPAVTQSATDTTAGRLLKVGDFGLGENVAPPSANSATSIGGLSSGFWRNTSSASTFGTVFGIPAGALIAGSLSDVTGLALLLGVGDQFALRSDAGGNSTSRLYGNNNILGTVSQASGQPTGRLIERGSNGNGEYVRFADGTQICNYTMAPSGSADTTWTFPAAFVTATFLNVIVAPRTGSDAVFGAARPPAVSSCAFNLWTTAGARSTGAVGLIAIGRWF